MSIQSIFNLPTTNLHTDSKIVPQRTPIEAQQRFGNFLKEAIEDVNRKQIASDQLTEKLVLGENVELHDVMIAAQKASIALNATMEVRNKVVEAYQEIIRMPV